jgi:hypothetical protein
MSHCCYTASPLEVCEEVVMATAEGLNGLYGPLGRPPLKDITAERHDIVADDVRTTDDADWWPVKSFKMTRSAMSRRRRGASVVRQLDDIARSGPLPTFRGELLGRPPPCDVMTLPEGSKVTVFRSRSAMECFGKCLSSTTSHEEKEDHDSVRRSTPTFARPKSSMPTLRNSDYVYSVPVPLPIPTPQSSFMTPTRARHDSESTDSVNVNNKARRLLPAAHLSTHSTKSNRERKSYSIE